MAKKSKKKKKKIDEKRLIIKFLACTVYMIVIMILFVCSYKLFQAKSDITPWQEVESTEQYSYIEISKMSEKFAYYEETNIGLHFVIEKEVTGQWRTYIVAIDENKYKDYKDIIDYTYERTDKIPNAKKVYGYPVITTDDIKTLAIKNIANFVPAENEVVISEENYETYLTNSYLDTTKSRVDVFNYYLFAVLFIIFLVIFLLILTIFNKDRLVDKVDEKLLEDIKKDKIIIKRKKR